MTISGRVLLLPQPTEPIVPSPLVIPARVQQRARANGAAGRTWLDELPEVVLTLMAQWDLELGSTMHGGTASFVASATDGVGRDCVLKVAMPLDLEGQEAFHRSVTVHRLADGSGCVELLAHDDAAYAMLLERLGPNLADLGRPLPLVLDAIGATLRTFWRPAPADCGLPTGADKAAWLVEYITRTWDELGRPCPRAVIDHAVSYCDARAGAFDPEHAVLVHGDAHGWNTVDAGDGSFKFVDPEGLRSEPAHDLSVPMREYNEPLLAGDTVRLVRERAESLAAPCGIDPEPVLQWGFIERVSTGLANLREFDGEGGLAFLEVAGRCL